MWMGHPLESSRTWSQLGWSTQRASQWRFIQAFGTPMTGPQEEVLSRLTGAKLHLLPRTGTSTVIRLVFGLLGRLLAAQNPSPTLVSWSRKNWITLANRDFVGCRRITWSTTIAPTLSDSHKACHLNALLGIDPRPLNLSATVHG